MLHAALHTSTPPPSARPAASIPIKPPTSFPSSGPSSGGSGSGSGFAPQTKAQAKAHQTIYNQGLEILAEVAGPKYVDEVINHPVPLSSSASSPDEASFSQPMHDLAVSTCWGSVWSRPGLTRKERSLLTIALLAAQNHPVELAVNVRGALHNGVSETEISETLLHTAAYSGIPAGMEAFRVAHKVVMEVRAESEGGGAGSGDDTEGGVDLSVHCYFISLFGGCCLV
ncbi:CMD-domain-containing protein [Xylona heveae TC161]|uniref:CMD-domain-containing protein n=1 Tax=Xylona heveae (strain CBS 132557 / TC161) TaxID=1328760 RepID=A0A165JGR1_XYLHT|nr:CMD-domain-containing protein [Xylona heveae TC161]KZF26216.1 CMD-domain-containing protein [Xylona heveae TC161]